MQSRKRFFFWNRSAVALSKRSLQPDRYCQMDDTSPSRRKRFDMPLPLTLRSAGRLEDAPRASLEGRSEEVHLKMYGKQSTRANCIKRFGQRQRRIGNLGFDSGPRKSMSESVYLRYP